MVKPGEPNTNITPSTVKIKTRIKGDLRQRSVHRTARRRCRGRPRRWFARGNGRGDRHRRGQVSVPFLTVRRVVYVGGAVLHISDQDSRGEHRLEASAR